MKFEERLNELINEAEVPDELLPQNIAQMLKAKSAGSTSESRPAAARQDSNASALRRTIIMRTAAAAAACAVFAVGMTVYNQSRSEQKEIESRISYEATSPVSYDELYSTYVGIDLNSGNDNDKPDSDTPIEDDQTGTGTTAPENFPEDPIAYSGTTPAESFTDTSAYDFADKEKYGKNVSEADIVKSDGKYVYCLKDRTLTVISLETMEIVSTFESSLDPPIEIYIDGDKIILISSETEETFVADGGSASAVTNIPEAEDPDETPDVPANGEDITNSADTHSDTLSQNDDIINSGEELALPAGKTVKRINTAVDIYSVGDAENPVLTASYKQNGSCIASRLVDGTLYIVTAYTDYRIKPLDNQADLDGFVPAYYINGEKKYIAASDIIVPSNANNTDYMVAAAINTDEDGVKASVKAVLGSSKNVYCSKDTVYIAYTEKDEKEYSIISSFELSKGGISYRSGCLIDGVILGQQCMNEYGGKFRAAARVTGENGITSTSVYVLNKSCEIVSRTEQLLTGGKEVSVRFEGNYARLFEKNAEKASAVIDISADPPAFVLSSIDSAAYLYSWGGKLAGIGRSQKGGISLSMYSSESGLLLDSIDFEEGDVFSRAFTDRRAVLIDETSGIIGVPVYSHNEFGTKNRYYVFSYDETAGFAQKGVIEYVDIDDSLVFERGEVIDGKLYVFSKGRVISARLSDLKVIGSYEY